MDESSRQPDGEPPVSRDTLLSAVANEQRRAILASLTEASENTLEYDALVDRLADLFHDEDGGRPSDDERLRARIVLHHAHLPKLAEAGIIEYEAGAGPVRFVGGELERELLTLVRSRNGDE
jgi:DNA-binding transcriptional ArsR family regulator